MNQKHLKTVLLIAIFRQSGDKWELKTQFLTIFWSNKRFRLLPIRCVFGHIFENKINAKQAFDRKYPIYKKYYSDRQKKRYSMFCYELHEAHKHELYKLTMARILSQASGLF